jgi:hypothetical protein
VPRSVLDEIREGNWDFEPTDVDENHYDSTIALPGSNEKIDALAQRAEQGLPLWHSEDRLSYDETAEALV